MKKVLLCWLAILLSVLHPSSLFSQNTELIEKLETQLPELTGVSKVDAFDDLAWEYRLKDLSKALAYAKDGLKLAQSIGYVEGKINCHNRIANVKQREGKYKEAIRSYEAALNLSTVQKDTFGIARGHHQIALNYRFLGEYQRALEQEETSIRFWVVLPDQKANLARVYESKGVINKLDGNWTEALADFNVSYTLASELGNKDNLGSLANSMGLLYETIGNLSTALGKYRESLRIFKEQKNLEAITTANLNIGNVFLKMSAPDSALVYYLKCYQQKSEITDQYILGNLFHNTGIVYQEIEDLTNAEIFFQRALAIREQQNNPKALAESYHELGWLNYYRNQLDEAQKLLNKSLDLLETTEDFLMKSDITALLAIISAESGNTEEMKQYFSLSRIYQDSLRETQNSISDEATSLLENQREIERYQAALKLSKLENQNQTNLIIFFGIGFVLLLLGGISLVLWLRGRQKVELAERDVRIGQEKLISLQQTQKLQQIRAKIKGQEEEQEKIARELHDEIGGVLSLAESTLRDLFREFVELESQQEEKYQRVNELLQQANTSVKEISRELGNSVLINLGLVKAVNQLTHDLRESNDLEVEFSHFNLEERLDPFIENHVYKIIRELTSNAVAHAEADSLSIELVKNASELSVMVIDDGKGFNPKQKENGKSLGYININSRIDEMGGTLEIDSGKGAGTTVNIHIPISDLNSNHS